ncbi:hypothetical protein [Marinicella sp. W31]|uniref:hypothetical protein n=1 Tax=Marinicella sp. W31 TaxID=3023713 RepID=UPI00375640F6
MTSEVSTWRLYAMRFLYLLTFIGIGFSSWSAIISPGPEAWDPLHGVAFSFWAAYATLMLFGVFIPLRMLPLLLLQLLYKSIWLLGVGLPLYSAGPLDANTQDLFYACAIGATLDLLIIPWPYVYKYYIKGLFQKNQPTH